MDYSTISNKTEVEELTGGDISEKYHLLRNQYNDLSSKFEAMKQELHETRRSYQTALDVQSHFATELESNQADERKRKAELTSKITALQEEISCLRQERTELNERHLDEIKKLELENKRLKEEKVSVERESPVRDTAEIEEVRAALDTASSEALATKVELRVAEDVIQSCKLNVEELKNEISELRAVAQIRKEEICAAGEREAAVLAELAEARAMLHQYNSQDLEPHAAKGNSLFAEVDDKRQEMAKTLIQMKQTNARLRRDLANKQAELDTLLHEKQTIWEQQAGDTAHHDRELIESFEKRITQLEALCEKQRRELARWFNKNCDINAQGWLPGVLEHFKTQCEQLRSEVLMRGAAELSSALLVRELRRKIASLTAHTNRSPVHIDNSDDTVNIQPIQVKRAIEDVKKKVSFN